MLSFFLSLLLSALSSVSFACVFRLSPKSVSLVCVFRCLVRLSRLSVAFVCCFHHFRFTFEFCFPHFGCPLCLLSLILGPLLCFI